MPLPRRAGPAYDRLRIVLTFGDTKRVDLARVAVVP
jgi:hypothetical protein